MPSKPRKRISKKYAFEKEVQIKLSKLAVESQVSTTGNDINIVDSENENIIIESNKQEREDVNKNPVREIDTNSILEEYAFLTIPEVVVEQQDNNKPLIIENEDSYLFKNNFNYEISSIKMNFKDLVTNGENKCLIN